MLTLLRSKTWTGEFNLGFDFAWQGKVKKEIQEEPLTGDERAQEEWATPIFWTQSFGFLRIL